MERDKKYISIAIDIETKCNIGPVGLYNNVDDTLEAIKELNKLIKPGYFILYREIDVDELIAKNQYTIIIGIIKCNLKYILK